MNNAIALRSTVLAALTLTLFATPALAQNAAETASGTADLHTLAISYADLDLSSAKGRATIDKRLRVAAASVCGGYDGTRPLSEEADFRNCYTSAISGARQTLALAQQQRQLVSR